MKTATASELLIPGAAIGGGFFTGQFFVGSQPFGLITAPKKEGEISAVQYMKARKKFEGANSFCDGRANTIELAKAGSPLGQWAIDLRIGGYDDWHIGGRLQKLMQFYNLRDVAAFASGGAEAFERAWYWSSTREGSGDAWGQHFDYGYQGYGYQYDKLVARAVRVISL